MTRLGKEPMMVGVRRLTVVTMLMALVAVALGGTASGAGADADARASAAKADPNYAPITSAERHEIAHVAPSTLAAIGNGGKRADLNEPRIKRWHKHPLSAHGKPELAMIVADFCPYCAAEEWSVAVALSRFGHLGGLTTISSSSTDVDPDTKSVSFRHATYRSKYLALNAIVNEGVHDQPLQPVPPKVNKAWQHYEGDELGYPFLDFANTLVVSGPSYDPKVLAGLSRAAIAAQLNDPTSRLADAVDGTANQLTAAICLVTQNRPKHVCATKTIRTIERQLG